MKYFSMFSGIGGFELGFERANKNFECIGFSEIDKYAIQVYQKHFPNHRNFGDANKINPAELPDFDLLCGGFPCQAFSIAGKRKGFNDTRGTLFFEIARIAEAKRPSYLLLENVKGLLNHNKGETFRTIIQTLSELGYDVQWLVLNSKFFGVPQNRERVFIIGSLGGKPRPEILPFGEDGKMSVEELNQIGTIGNDSEATRVYSSEGIARTIKDGGGMGAKTGLYEIKNPQVMNTIQNAVGTRAGSSASFKASVKNIHNVTGKIRRLTPTECERLQGFPDGWTSDGKVFNNVLLLGNIWEEANVQLKIVQAKWLLENHCFVLNTTKDGKGGEILIQSILPKEKIKETVQSKAVIEKLTAEKCVCDIINLGKDMVMLYNPNGTSNIKEITQKSHIQEKMGKPNTYPLWKISLEENLSKERLSIILTLIKKTILKETFTCLKTGKPITNAIIVWNKQELNYSKRDTLFLEMESIVQMSDTQRYKVLGNAVTTNVVQAVAEKLLLSGAETEPQSSPVIYHDNVQRSVVRNKNGKSAALLDRKKKVK